MGRHFGHFWETEARCVVSRPGLLRSSLGQCRSPTLWCYSIGWLKEGAWGFLIAVLLGIGGYKLSERPPSPVEAPQRSGQPEPQEVKQVNEHGS